MNDNQKLLDQLKKMNELSMENMMNQLRLKMLNKKLKKDSNNMLQGLQSQLPTSPETNPNTSSLNDLMS